MMMDREQQIRERAHKLWEEEGRPEGGHEDHWRRAEEQIGSSDLADAEGETEENWRVEAGLAEEKPKLDIAPTIIAPD